MAATLLSLALPISTEARLRCPGSMALGPEEKVARVEGMIQRYHTSNKSKRYTSGNRVAMRRCLEGNVDRIIDDIDDGCAAAAAGPAIRSMMSSTSTC
jgi:hypothetical protein